MPPQVTSIEDDWKKLKLQNAHSNTEAQKTNIQGTLSSYDLPLPVNADGSLNFFWFDAHEENYGAEIYLFGKVWQPQIQSFMSCCLVIHGMERVCYALPKVKGKARGTISAEDETKMVNNVFTELEEIRKRRFKDISGWKAKEVKRKYAFEMALQHGEHSFLKIKYPASMPMLPDNLTGNTFECVFGTNQSMLELFILKRKIKGPCWLTINGFKKLNPTDFRRSWCKHELIIDDPKTVNCSIEDLNKPSPPLVTFTFSIKTTRNSHNTNEIAMISCIV